MGGRPTVLGEDRFPIGFSRKQRIEGLRRRQWADFQPFTPHRRDGHGFPDITGQQSTQCTSEVVRKS